MTLAHGAKVRSGVAMVPQLIADVGGTNTRFAIGQAGRFRHMRELRNEEHATFQDAVRHFLAGLPVGMRVSKAVLAVAGWAPGDVVSLTNHHWTFSVERVREEFGLSELKSAK
jgi:glucokinase